MGERIYSDEQSAEERGREKIIHKNKRRTREESLMFERGQGAERGEKSGPKDGGDCGAVRQGALGVEVVLLEFRQHAPLQHKSLGLGS